jgi:hypothetical protein
LSFLCLVFSVCQFGSPSLASAQVSLTWLNLLSVQPLRAHTISFPRLAREAHGTHSLKRVLKDPGVNTGSVTLQIVRDKIIHGSFAFAHGLGAWSFRPRSWALQRPVRTRHQSTAKVRAMATMIFLRRDRLVLGFKSSAPHFLTT